jgi:hypothetical protein
MTINIGNVRSPSLLHIAPTCPHVYFINLYNSVCQQSVIGYIGDQEICNQMCLSYIILRPCVINGNIRK